LANKIKAEEVTIPSNFR